MTGSAFFKKLWNDYGIIGILIILAIIYALFLLYSRLSVTGKAGSESMSQQRNEAYSSESKNEPQGAVENGSNGYSSVDNSVQQMEQVGAQTPADLLPKDTNSEWAQLNPAGKGDLENVNLLKAGYHIGIDTVGQTLRNANLQVRSEPPNPQLDVGPWNNTTISPDVMRPALEIGQGAK